MSAFAFVQTVDGLPGGTEAVRLCATSESSPLPLRDGGARAPAQVQVGDVLKVGPVTLRVDRVVQN